MLGHSYLDYHSWTMTRVWRCETSPRPLEVGTMSEEGHANMFVSLDDSFESCTLSHVNAFIGNLRKTLNIILYISLLSSDVALKLYCISSGSLKLIFQMLQFFSVSHLSFLQ